MVDVGEDGFPRAPVHRVPIPSPDSEHFVFTNIDAAVDPVRGIDRVLQSKSKVRDILFRGQVQPDRGDLVSRACRWALGLSRSQSCPAHLRRFDVRYLSDRLGCFARNVSLRILLGDHADRNCDAPCRT